MQLGTADPALALKATLMVAQDIAFVDVNCGCPKSFSIQGGMGAALLSDPDRLCAVCGNRIFNFFDFVSLHQKLKPINLFFFGFFLLSMNSKCAKDIEESC